MPMLDVSSVLLDPLFAEPFTVIQRSEAIGDNGRAGETPVSIPNVIGVWLPDRPAGLDRGPDSSMAPRGGSFITTFKLRQLGPGYKADQVQIGNILYTVTEVLPFSRFGAGFTEARLSSMNATDPVQ